MFQKMVDAADFIKTLYIQERIIEAIELDVTHSRVTLKIDRLSRIRSADGDWDFYTDEDIEHCSIVFAGCTVFELASAGRIPREITGISKLCKLDRKKYHIEIDASQYDFNLHDVADNKIKITFTEIYLEDDNGNVIRS